MCSDVARRCRHCGGDLSLTVANLGLSPVANDNVSAAQYWESESFYPLEARVCRDCRLVQTVDVRPVEQIFRADYAYFSSQSTTWVEHAKTYVDDMVRRFNLGARSTVVEIGSNDGYLLQFVQDRGIRCIGVEPCASVARAAQVKGIETHIAFFGSALAQSLVQDGWRADLLVANNVLAHVPDINDFVGGVRTALAPQGVATFEVQHLLKLMQRHQFDTIYHEHFSYLSLLAAQHVFEAAGLRIFDVEELDTHGGSIRFLVCRAEADHPEQPVVDRILRNEIRYGLDRDEAYLSWNESVRETKRALLELLIDLKRRGKSIVAYGAPAKGVTLLNYCGIGLDFLDYTVDRAPSKVGRFMPGVRLPILHADRIFETKPDFILILPWNLKDEIETQLAGVREWGAQFIVPVPIARIETPRPVRTSGHWSTRKLAPSGIWLSKVAAAATFVLHILDGKS